MLVSYNVMAGHLPCQLNWQQHLEETPQCWSQCVSCNFLWFPSPLPHPTFPAILFVQYNIWSRGMIYLQAKWSSRARENTSLPPIISLRLFQQMEIYLQQTFGGLGLARLDTFGGWLGLGWILHRGKLRRLLSRRSALYNRSAEPPMANIITIHKFVWWTIL